MDLLVTRRLRLREFSAADAPFILELLNTRGWLRNIGDRGVRSPEDARTYIESRLAASYRQHGFGLYLVSLKEPDTPVGMCGLIRREGLEDVDIGFAFLPRYAGKGYALEAAQAVMDYAVRTLGLERIVAITLPENESSIRLLKRLGMTQGAVIRLPGDEEDLLLFEWRLPTPGHPAVTPA